MSVPFEFGGVSTTKWNLLGNVPTSKAQDKQI